MGRMIAYGLVIAGSFALAAGGSWYLNQSPDAQSDNQAAADVENSDADSTDLADADSNTVTSEAEVTHQTLPSAVPPRSMSAEDLYRIGEMMNAREKSIIRREKILEDEDRRIKLIMRDIDAEQQETDGLFTQVRGTLDSAAQLLEQLRAESEQLSAAKLKQEAEAPEDNSAAMPDENEMKRIKKWATYYQGMAPEKAASILTKMADDGRTDEAARIISLFDERKASKILEAIPDEQLLLELADESAKLRQPKTKATRR